MMLRSKCTRLSGGPHHDDDVRGLGERFQKEFGHVNILVAHHAVRSESGAAGAAGLVQFLAAF